MQSSWQLNNLILITNSYTDSTVCICFSVMNNTYTKPIAIKCTGTDVAYNFSRVFVSGFRVRLFFCRHARSLQIYRTRWITSRINRQNDLPHDASAFSRLKEVSEVGNRWGSGGAVCSSFPNRGRSTRRCETVTVIERTAERGFRKSRLLHCCHGTRVEGFKLHTPSLSQQKEGSIFRIFT